MAWPPPVLPTNRQDLTPQTVTHPAEHNAENLAINDLVAKVTGIDTELAGALRTTRTWTPNWVVGGVGVSNAGLAGNWWLQVGKLRVGAAAWTNPSGPASPGGFLVGNGFWSATARLYGVWHYFQSGVTNHVGVVLRYDASTISFQKDDQSNIFGLGPAMIPSPGHAFQFLVVAIEN